MQRHLLVERAVGEEVVHAGGGPTLEAVGAALDAQFAFEAVDVGGLAQALHLEHMTLLWVRMVRAGGQSPHMVWAMLKR